MQIAFHRFLYLSDRLFGIIVYKLNPEYKKNKSNNIRIGKMIGVIVSMRTRTDRHELVKKITSFLPQWEHW